MDNKNDIHSLLRMEIEMSEADPSWHKILHSSITENMSEEYIKTLFKNDFFPSLRTVFSPFKTPFNSVNFVLFGESPYPRINSAIGLSFIDGDVSDIWSDNGLSKKVNKATSLRNIIKTAMVAEGLINSNFTKQDIVELDKRKLSKTMNDIKDSFISSGFLLLNASPILRSDRRKKVIKEDFFQWSGFYRRILEELDLRKDVSDSFIVLWGGVAKDIEPLYKPVSMSFLKMEHPYNISFISNPDAISLFSRISILRKY